MQTPSSYLGYSIHLVINFPKLCKSDSHVLIIIYTYSCFANCKKRFLTLDHFDIRLREEKIELDQEHTVGIDF